MKQIITLCLKKVSHLFLIITSPIVDRFLKLFHQQIRRKILRVHMTKISTSSAIWMLLHYKWNSKIETVTGFNQICGHLIAQI